MTLDSSVMNVSIATVAKDVGTTVTGIQTAITLYTLVMASLMITGGKLGQIVGRKRAFAIGCVIYGCCWVYEVPQKHARECAPGRPFAGKWTTTRSERCAAPSCRAAATAPVAAIVLNAATAAPIRLDFLIRVSLLQMPWHQGRRAPLLVIESSINSY
jgi:MFS family permease